MTAYEMRISDWSSECAIPIFSALPPQVVRLKSDAPMSTLHYMQDVYDDGTFRADPWRWWFAWVAIELIARRGPDRDGSRIRRFVLEDPSLETVRVSNGRAHVWTPVTNAPLVCRLLLEKKKHWRDPRQPCRTDNTKDDKQY